MAPAAATETNTGKTVTVLPAVSVAVSVNESVAPASLVPGVQLTLLLPTTLMPLGALPEGSE